MKSDSRVTRLSAMIKALAVLIKPAAPSSKLIEIRESDEPTLTVDFCTASEWRNTPFTAVTPPRRRTKSVLNEGKARAWPGPETGDSWLFCRTFTEQHVNFNVFYQHWKYHSEGLCVWCYSVSHLLNSAFPFLHLTWTKKKIAVIEIQILIYRKRLPSLGQNILHLVVQ